MTAQEAIKYIPLFVWICIIFILSGEPAGVSSQRSGFLVNIIEPLANVASEDVMTFLVRKSAHVFLYFVLGVLIYNVVKDYKLVTKKAIAVSIIVALSYATFDELHQTFVPGRSGEVRDVLIDTAAASAGIGAYYWINRRILDRKRMNEKS